MVELKMKNGLTFVAKTVTDDKGGEVLLQYFVNEKNEVLDDNVTCTCTCGSGSSQTTDSKTCTQQQSQNATCNCTGSSASVSC